MHWSPFFCFGDKIGGYSIVQLGTCSRSLGTSFELSALNHHNRSTGLVTAVFGPSHWKSIMGVKNEAQYLNKCAKYIVGLYLLSANRKPHLASPMVTWPMMSGDPKGQGRDPKSPISLRLNISTTVWNRQWIQIDHQQETIYCQSNGHVTDDVTSRGPKRQCRDPQNLWGTITVQIRRLVQTDHI